MPRSFSGLGARRSVVVILGLVVGGIVLVPTILAAAAPPAVGSAAPLDLGARGAGPGRILRGDATVLKRDGSTADIHFERGVVASLTATSITVTGADGVSTTFGVASGTRVRGSGRRLELADVKVGARVAVLSAGRSTGSAAAALIRLLPARPAKTSSSTGGGAVTPTPSG